MATKITYTQLYTRCGKKNCIVCRDGAGHGPYWYSYQYVNGKTEKTYIGLFLPPDVYTLGRSHETAFIGRTGEFERLKTILMQTEQLKSSRVQRTTRLATVAVPQRPALPQLLLLLGELGLGKTRLAEELGREAQARGWTVLWEQTFVQDKLLLYRVWVDLLRKLLTLSGVQEEIERGGAVYHPLSVLLPELSTTFPGDTLSPQRGPFEPEQSRVWEAIGEVLRSATLATPVLIILDDIHWGDTSSCNFLLDIAHRVGGLPLLFVGTCRESELAADHPFWSVLRDPQHEHAVELLQLEPLSHESIAALIAHVPSLSPAMVTTIQERAAGNPFFAEELARMNASSSSSSLPDSISKSIAHRIDQLSKDCQQLLRKAAVLGGPFTFDVLQAVEGSPADVGEERVLALLDEALQSGIVIEDRMVSPITYRFWHPLLMSHLYEDLSAPRRASIHRKVAEVLRLQYFQREQEGAALILHHLILGGADPQRIVSEALRAGDYAYSLCVYPDAENHYGVAAEWMERGGNSIFTSGESHAHLFEQLGECARIQGKSREARTWYERALQVRDRASAHDEVWEAQYRSILYCEIGLTWYDEGAFDRALASYDQAEERVRAVGGEGGTAWAYIRFQQSYVDWQRGEYNAASVKAQEALQGFKAGLEDHDLVELATTVPRTRTQRILAGDPVDVGRAYVLLGSLALAQGRASESELSLRSALDIYERSLYKREIATVCCTLGVVFLRRGAYEQARDMLQRSLSTAEYIGDVPLLAVVSVNFGELALRRGEMEEAEEQLRRAIALAERIHDPVYTSIFHAYLAVSLQAQEKETEARKSVACALRHARSLQSTHCLGLASMVLAAIYIMRFRRVYSTRDDEKQVPAMTHTRWLARAERLLQRVVNLRGIESEVQVEALVYLAEVAFLQGDKDQARRTAQRALHDVQRDELFWLSDRLHSILHSSDLPTT